MEYGIKERLLISYQELSNPTLCDQTIIDNLSKSVLELYNIPETLFSLFSLFEEKLDSKILISICIGIKHMLSDEERWNYYQEHGEEERIKNFFLYFLKEIKNDLIFDNLLASLKIILKTSESNWEEYFNLLKTFSENGNEIEFNYSLKMSELFIYYSSNQILSNFWNFFCDLVNKSFQISNCSIILSSFKVLKELFGYSNDFNEHLYDLFLKFNELFLHLIQENNNNNNNYIFNNFIDTYNSIFNSEFEFTNIENILNEFLNLVNNSNFDIDLRCSLFEPINYILANNYKDKYLKGIIDIIFQVGKSSYLPNVCIEEQENLNKILETIINLNKVCQHQKLYKYLIKKLNNLNGASEIVIFSESIINLISIIPEKIHQEIKTFIEFGFSCLSYLDDHTVQETGLNLFIELFKRHNEYYYKIIEEYFNKIFQILKIPNVELIRKGLISLKTFLSFSININEYPKFILPIFEILLKIFDEYPIYLKGLIIDCFTALIKSSQEEILIISERLLNLLLILIRSETLPETVDIQGSSLECIGYLLRYFPQNNNLNQEIIEILIKGISSDESFLISSSMIGLTQIIQSKISEVLPFINTIIEISHKILNTEPAYENDEDKEEENEIMEDVLFSTMELIQSICKNIPNSLINVVEILKEDLYKLIDLDIEDFQTKAIKTLQKLNNLTPNNSFKFLKIVISLIEDTFSTSICSTCFSIFSKIIQEKYIILEENVLNSIFECSFQGIRRELICLENYQNLKNYDYDFGDSLYEFLQLSAYSYPNIFPIHEFWETIKIILQKGNEFEISNIIGVLSSYYNINYNNIDKLFKKLIIQLFIQKLDICDFYVYPYPISAVRLVAEFEPNLLDKYLKNIIEFIDYVFSEEYDSQLTYSLTLEFTDSLLMTLFRNIYKENFPTDKYLGKMLIILPLVNTPSESENIYNSIIYLCGMYPEIMGQYGSEIVRVLAQTFAKKQSDWDNINLPEELIQSCGVLLNNLIIQLSQGKLSNVVPQIQQLLKEPDEEEIPILDYERMIHRLQYVLESQNIIPFFSQLSS